MHEEHHSRTESQLRSYMVGFALSILLTLVAFGLTQLHLLYDHHFISHELIKPIIVILALGQLASQSIFFLHLNMRKQTRHNFVTYVFAIYTVAFIVIGSLWIMNNLNQNMSPSEIDAYMHGQN